MICPLIKILVSHALDEGRPVPGFVRRHAGHCEKCRIFVETAENIEVLLPIEAGNISLPEGLRESQVIDISSRTVPVFLAVAAVMIAILGFIHTERQSTTIDSLTMQSSAAVNEILDNPELAGIFTGSLIQQEIDALVEDTQTAFASLRSLMELTP